MASVNSLFFDAVLAAANPVDVAMPNIGFNPESLESYYQVFVSPGKSSSFDLTITNQQGGFCQVSCFVKEKVGEIKAVSMAEKIIGAFPRLTKLKGDGLVVEVVQPAYYTQGLPTDNGWYMVPVTIPYTTYN